MYTSSAVLMVVRCLFVMVGLKVDGVGIDLPGGT